ncbi:MAG TPA: phage baseplate protein [Vicinamibacteria bacterium]|nr:phage baseplate protein [Vicinamibacteria bacterium]
MRPLSPAEVLSLWELGSALPPLERALLLLRAALPDQAPGELARLPLGRRDRLLVELRAATFGAELPFFARCPACAGEVEFTMGANQLLAGGPPERGVPEPRELRAGEAWVLFRLPDSRDLAAAGAAPPERAEEAIFERCVLEARVAGVSVQAGELSATVREALASAIAEADPDAEVTVALSCPACGRGWSGLFDILSVLWSEVAGQARRLLQEVDALARAYGWREADVLALPPKRRALYLEMVTA